MSVPSSTAAPAATPADSPEVRALLGELPAEPFTAGFVASVQAIEDYGVEWTLELARELGLDRALAAAPSTARELARELGFAPAFDPALRWLLSRLATAGHLVREGAEEGEAARFRLPKPLRDPRRAALRALGLELDPANAASLELLDAAGEAYPAVARGEMSGQQALLGPHKVSLWARYFHNENPIYAINNTIAATAVVNRLPAAGARLLEVGAGGGSASEAVLSLLAERGRLASLASYRITEPSPFFRRRAQRSLSAAHPELPLAFAELDIDKPWGEQGIEPASVDLLFGVNVVHVARDLGFSLAEARRALAPGGWLIAEECIRPTGGKAISTEMVFQLLESFTEVKTDPETRPTAGFMTVAEWRVALSAAGFEGLEVVPDLERITEHFPLFFSGALCARRPA